MYLKTHWHVISRFNLTQMCGNKIGWIVYEQSFVGKSSVKKRNILFSV